MASPYILGSDITNSQNNNGVFWQGADGKVYVKGGQGTNAAGNYDANSSNYWTSRGFSQINDPLGAGNTTQSPGSIYGGGGAPAPVYAPKLNVAAISSQARAQAEQSVNPIYTKYLNDFLGEQAFKKQVQEEQTATNIKNYQDTLAQTQEGNAVTGARTTEDTALKQTNINTANDQNQVDTGNAFEDARLAAATKLATGGVIGTGAGNRATGVATADRNTQEGRQNDAFQQSRDQAELFKTRTFEDLATSNKNATAGEAKGEAQANFDLQNFIKQQSFDETAERNKLREDQLKETAAKTQDFAKLAFNNYLAGIKNPAQYAAAVNTYGGQF